MPNIVDTVRSLLQLSNVGRILPAVVAMAELGGRDDFPADRPENGAGAHRAELDCTGDSFTAAHVLTLNRAIQLSLVSLFSQPTDMQDPQSNVRKLNEVVLAHFLSAASPFDGAKQHSECLLAGLMQATAALLVVSMPWPYGLDRPESRAARSRWNLRTTAAISGLSVAVTLWKCLLTEQPILHRKRDVSFFTACRPSYDVDRLWESVAEIILRHVCASWQHPGLYYLPPQLYSSILRLQSALFARSSQIFKAIVSRYRLKVCISLTRDPGVNFSMPVKYRIYRNDTYPRYRND